MNFCVDECKKHKLFHFIHGFDALAACFDLLTVNFSCLKIHFEFFLCGNIGM